MKLSYKTYYFLFLFFAISFKVFCEISEVSQNGVIPKKDVLPFSTKVVCMDSSSEKIMVNIYNLMNFDFKVDSNTPIKTFELGIEGKLLIDVPKDVAYIIEITKKGFVHKRFSVDTKNLPYEAWIEPYPGFNVESVSLFKKVPGINYQLFNYPLAIIEFNFDKENFDYNSKYSDLALSAIDIIKELESKHFAWQSSRIEYFRLEKINQIIMFSYSIALIGLIVIIMLLASKLNKSKKN